MWVSVREYYRDLSYRDLSCRDLPYRDLSYRRDLYPIAPVASHGHGRPWEAKAMGAHGHGRPWPLEAMGVHGLSLCLSPCPCLGHCLCLGPCPCLSPCPLPQPSPQPASQPRAQLGPNVPQVLPIAHDIPLPMTHWILVEFWRLPDPSIQTGRGGGLEEGGW